jgi:hypothetical protein
MFAARMTVVIQGVDMVGFANKIAPLPVVQALVKVIVEGKR